MAVKILREEPAPQELPIKRIVANRGKGWNSLVLTKRNGEEIRVHINSTDSGDIERMSGNTSVSIPNEDVVELRDALTAYIRQEGI